MRDVFDAIEQLSALLATQIEKAAGRRGWASRASTRVLGVGPGRQVHLIGVTVNLPQGVSAAFQPRPEPAGDGWAIDVQRSDGVARRSFAPGLRVGKAGGAYQVQHPDGALDEARIDAILDDLGRPGPSGVALWVRKVWAIRFGRMPLQVAELLDRVKDADRLDDMHGAVLRALDPQDAAAQLARLGN